MLKAGDALTGCGILSPFAPPKLARSGGLGVPCVCILLLWRTNR